MKRYDIINKLIKKYNYKTYLEIGTQQGQGFVHIDIPQKVCIDPIKQYSELTHEMTSDDYFEKYNNKFDIIFVDGLHTEEQATKDIVNSLKCLEKNGTIVVHDCLPHCEEFIQVCWNGTVFRSIIDLRYNNSKVNIQVVDTDNGCGIIRRGKQELYSKVPYEVATTYDYFDTNRHELMNIITTSEFLKKYN